MPSKKKSRLSTGSQDDSKEQNDLYESFSPVKLPESPVLQKQGNLTGSARKLKDGAADLHNLILKWNNLNIDGSNVLTDIANTKLETILSQDSATPLKLLPESLLPLCDKLEEVLQRMEKVVDRLTGLTEMCGGVSRLEQYSHQGQTDIVLFQTWDVQRFESVFRQISEMYRQEMKLKHSIAGNICHVDSRDSVMFYSAAWLHQPYIHTDSNLLLESMLLETGHKT